MWWLVNNYIFYEVQNVDIHGQIPSSVQLDAVIHLACQAASSKDIRSFSQLVQ